jgi:hypothetical protein
VLEGEDGNAGALQHGDGRRCNRASCFTDLHADPDTSMTRCLFLAPSKCEPDLAFQTAVVRIFLEAFAVGAAGDLVGESEIRRGNVAGTNPA